MGDSRIGVTRDFLSSACPWTRRRLLLIARTHIAFTIAFAALLGSLVLSDFAYSQTSDELLKAATAGEPSAMTNLGYLYQNGNGVQQDYAHARGWYEKAAALGEPAVVAMFDLGGFYYGGNGLQQNLSLAPTWYAKAAAAGDDEAKERIKGIDGRTAQANSRSQDQQDPADVIRLLYNSSRPAHVPLAPYAQWSNRMKKLWAKEDRATEKYGVGALDFDFLCGCQDERVVWSKSNKAVIASQSATRARIIVQPGGRLKFNLILEAGLWVIDEVTAGDPDGYMLSEILSLPACLGKGCR